MNKKIATLANGPRGKPWRSRLVPYEADIRQMRKAGESYQTIAAWMAERGLIISGSAIHGFVRARARRGRRQYVLPHAATDVTTDARENITAAKLPIVESQSATLEKPVSTAKSFVFKPIQQRTNRFDPEDLQINDPLA